MLSRFKEGTFTDVECGVGAAAGFAFAVSTTGTLVQVDLTTSLLEVWADGRAGQLACVSVCEDAVVVGGQSGVVRIFDPVSLDYIGTLPTPPALGMSNLPAADPAAAARAVAAARAAAAAAAAAQSATGSGSTAVGSPLLFPAALAVRMARSAEGGYPGPNRPWRRVAVVYGDRGLFVWGLPLRKRRQPQVPS